MDDIVEFIIEIAGDALECVFDNIKNPQKRKWALTSFYSVITLLIEGIPLWGTISFLQEKNHIGAIVLGGITALIAVVFGFFIIRGHRQNWNRNNQ